MNDNTDEFLKPFRVLGVDPKASFAEIRARYLLLLKRYPPERDAERFEELQSAYEIVSDPMRLAKRVIRTVAASEEMTIESLLKEQQDNPPKMSAKYILSLGNATGRVAQQPSNQQTNELQQGEQ